MTTKADRSASSGKVAWDAELVAAAVGAFVPPAAKAVVGAFVPPAAAAAVGALVIMPPAESSVTIVIVDANVSVPITSLRE